MSVVTPEDELGSMIYLMIGLGGALGAMVRFFLIEWAVRRFLTFPVGTLMVNLTGSFALGVVLVLLIERFTVPDEIRLFLAIGFLGGYTTFSTFSWETAQLLRHGRLVAAVLNVLLTAGGGLLAAVAGIAVGRML